MLESHYFDADPEDLAGLACQCHATIGYHFLKIEVLLARPPLRQRSDLKPPRAGVNRRDLLRLRRLNADMSAGMPGPVTALVQVAPSGGWAELLRAHRPAMGSFFEVRLGARVPGALELAGRALDLVDELEAQLTVYRDDSEVSKLNAQAHLQPVAVEPRLFELLERAIELSRQTNGAYDVSSGALSEAWGFVRGPKRVPDPETLAEARARTGWQHLRLDSQAKTVGFDRPGIQINLGSIGKGYAIDRATEVIRDHWFPTSALVHGGQSSLFAVGSPPGRLGGRWEVALRNPFEPETPLGVLRLRNQGLGTSGGAFQHFEAGGRVYGHIIDPRTGEPADGPASVTVVALTAAEADALSTAFFLLGADAAEAFVAGHPGVGIIIVEQGESDRSPRVLAFGMGPEDFLSG
jgi:FAD:protein FMN transferase